MSPRERTLADFFENAVVSLHWVAADGIILWANQSELDLLGYTAEEYIGHHIAEFHVDQSVIEDILRRLAAGEKLSNCEARLRCKDGTLKQVLISSSVRFEEGKFIHTRCFTIDITERKQAEDRIVLLYQLTAAFSEAVTPQEVTRVIMEQGLPLLRASGGSVALLDKTKTVLEMMTAPSAAEATTQPNRQISIEDAGVLAESVRTQHPVWRSPLNDLQSLSPTLTQLKQKESMAEAAIPLMIEKRVIGSLALTFSTPQSFDDQERRFMIALAQQCAQALERTRLSEEAREMAVLEERQRLARDLHDSVSQSLFSIYTLAQAMPRLWERDQEKARVQLEQLAMIARGATAEMRTLLLELRPANLVKSSLQELLMQIIDSVQARRRIAITAHVALEQVLPEDVHIALYRIAQEGINNIVKHSHATEGHVTLTTEADQVILCIQDNGRGFQHDETTAGLGLGVMQERAALIGATLTVESQLDVGTRVVVIWNFAA